MARSIAAESDFSTVVEQRKQKITLTLSVDLVRKAKELAAKRATTLSSLVATQLAELAAKEDSYTRAREQAVSILRSGFGFDGIEHMTRDEMHERKSVQP